MLPAVEVTPLSSGTVFPRVDGEGSTCRCLYSGEYNRYRPHSSLNYQTAEEFANSVASPRELLDNAPLGPKTLTLSDT